jgi:RNA polymerase sigma factor (sigma-70 family)
MESGIEFAERREGLLGRRSQHGAVWHMGNSRSTGPTTCMSMLDRCRQGDNRAWHTFFGIYGPLVFRYARHARLSNDEADEVVAAVMQSFVQAFRGGFKVDHAVGRFRHYLKTVANHAIAAQRRRRGPPTVPIGPEPIDGRGEPDWDTIEQQELLRMCLERLAAAPAVRPRDLLIFQCYAIEGQPPERVAKEFAISVSRVYAVKHEIIQLLRRERIKLESELRQRNL